MKIQKHSFRSDIEPGFMVEPGLCHSLGKKSGDMEKTLYFCKMKDGTIINVEHYITREDMFEVSDRFLPTQAFKEIEDFLSLKIDRTGKNK